MTAVDAVAPDLGATQACQALGISRATLYRRRRPPMSTTGPSRARPPRALSDAERQTVRAVSAGMAIVHPLTDEEWGVRRFFFEDPSGNVVNVLSHR